MTRHLIRSTTSLAFYEAMKARGKTAEETGKIVYLPLNSAFRFWKKAISPSAASSV